MKTIKLILVACAIGVIACNSAQKAEEEKRRQQKKMEQMEKERDEFERKNQKEIK